MTKPGGRVAFAVWQAPDQNSWFSAVNGKLMALGVLNPPPPGMPGPFRFGAPGSLAAELERAGFSEVADMPRSAPMPWPGSPEEYLTFQRGTLPAIRNSIDGAAPERREAIAAEVLGAIGSFYDGTTINFEARVFIVTATR